MSDLTGTKGGSGVWQRIISEMPAHQVYIEPFWGRGTIARKKRPALVTIGIDLDPAAMESGRGLALMFLANGPQWVKDYFRLSSPAAGSGAARSTVATRCVPVRNAVNGVARAARRKAAVATVTSKNGGPPPLLEAAPPATSRAPATAAAASTFGGVDVGQHFVYFDPPYLGCHGYYKHELTQDEHADLCRTFLSLPCPAAISGYHSELYADLLSGCRQIHIPTVNRRGKRVTEVLWMNFPPPVRYHDTRYVGTNRRVRERIRRRVRNWQANMGDMGPAERQAVFEACTAVFSGASR